MKKNIGLKVTLILGIIAFTFILIDCFALFRVWQNDLVRESLEGTIVNLSFIPVIIFYISFFITFYKYQKEYGVEYKKSVTPTMILFIISFFFVILDFLALTDIGHGEPDLRLEWVILLASALIFISFFISFFITRRKLLSGSS